MKREKNELRFRFFCMVFFPGKPTMKSDRRGETPNMVKTREDEK